MPASQSTSTKARNQTMAAPFSLWAWVKPQPTELPGATELLSLVCLTPVLRVGG